MFVSIKLAGPELSGFFSLANNSIFLGILHLELFHTSQMD
jgi:hypothetical protein